MSNEENEEYLVESITRARVAKKPGRGKRLMWEYRVKWKGWDEPEHDTWETLESFNGSEHFVETFWQRAEKSLKGRDIDDMSLFKFGEEFVPIGPPRKIGRKSEVSITKPVDFPAAESSEQGPSSSSRKTKRKRKSSITEQNASSSALQEWQEDQPSRPKRAKRNQPVHTPQHTPRETTRTVNKNRRVSLEIVPPSEDEEDVIITPPEPLNSSSDSTPSRQKRPQVETNGTSPEPSQSIVDSLQRAYAMTPEEHVPTRRTRSTNPHVKMVDDFTEMEGAITVKAQLSGKPVHDQLRQTDYNSPTSSKATRKRKPGPGRSSTGILKNTSSLLTFEKGELKSVKGRYTPASTSQMWEMHQADIPEDNIVDEPANSESRSDLAQEPVPTSEQLLELAGLDKEVADGLDDFDDEAPAAEPAEEKTASVFQQSLSSLFPASFSAASASVTNVVSAAWKRSTIFGPLGLASESQPKSSVASESVSSSTLFQLNLDVSVSIPVELTDVSTKNSSSLDSVIAISSKGPPGKFYSKEGALKVLDTLRSVGHSARVVPSKNAANSQMHDFERLLQRLSQDELFIAVAGVEVLAFCSSDSALISQRLNVPSYLISQSGSILVSRVSIENHSAYASAIMEVDPVHW